MGLRAQVIDLIRLNVADQPGEVRSVSQVAVVQLEGGDLRRGGPRRGDQFSGCSRRRTPLDPVNLIALIKQELRKVGAILASDAGYKCALHIWCSVIV